MELNLFFILLAVAFVSGKPVSEDITTTIPPTTVESITAVPTTINRDTVTPTTSSHPTSAPTTAVPTKAITNQANPSTNLHNESPHIKEVVVLAPPEEISVRDLEEEIIRDVEEEIMREEEEEALVREVEEEVAEELVREVVSEAANEGADVVIVRPLITEGRHARCRLIRQTQTRGYPSRRRQGFLRPYYAPSRPARPSRPFRPRPEYLRPAEEEPRLQIIF